MTTTLQGTIQGIEEPSLVVLGCGLCGNGLRGLKAGRHCLLVPRVSDCIALLLGSHETYQKEFSAVPATYYLSRGWIEAGEILPDGIAGAWAAAGTQAQLSTDDDFLISPPGGEIRLVLFVR